MLNVLKAEAFFSLRHWKKSLLIFACYYAILFLLIFNQVNQQGKSISVRIFFDIVTEFSFLLVCCVISNGLTHLDHLFYNEYVRYLILFMHSKKRLVLTLWIEEFLVVSCYFYMLFLGLFLAFLRMLTMRGDFESLKSIMMFVIIKALALMKMSVLLVAPFFVTPKKENMQCMRVGILAYYLCVGAYSLNSSGEMRERLLKWLSPFQLAGGFNECRHYSISVVIVISLVEIFILLKVICEKAAKTDLLRIGRKVL